MSAPAAEGFKRQNVGGRLPSTAELSFAPAGRDADFSGGFSHEFTSKVVGFVV